MQEENINEELVDEEQQKTIPEPDCTAVQNEEKTEDSKDAYEFLLTDTVETVTALSSKVTNICIDMVPLKDRVDSSEKQIDALREQQRELARRFDLLTDQLAKKSWRERFRKLISVFKRRKHSCCCKQNADDSKQKQEEPTFQPSALINLLRDIDSLADTTGLSPLYWDWVHDNGLVNVVEYTYEIVPFWAGKGYFIVGLTTRGKTVLKSASHTLAYKLASFLSKGRSASAFIGILLELDPQRGWFSCCSYLIRHCIRRKSDVDYYDDFKAQDKETETKETPQDEKLLLRPTYYTDNQGTQEDTVFRYW